MHKFQQRMLCLITAFLLLCPVFAYAESLSDVSVAAAPLSSEQPTLNGMVRVYLSSLGSPTSLTLTIAGSYSLSDGTTLNNGETLNLSFNSATGAITLTRNGVAYQMGTSFTLRRHSTTGANGVQIAQARKPSNLYPGDIQFKAAASGSGYKLYTIAHIYLENYLYGVVPYEMGSSAPLEALKAQAVAARTYTLRMMNARTGWMYDVVDTTGDQTYNGTPSTTSNCNTAVDQTKGVLIKNGSAYTATYYSASNGGQTESILHAWGTSGYDYLGVKDDPFDYANTSSVVKQTTVYKDASNTANSAALMSLLKTKAVSALTGAGYHATAANTTLQTINSITAHTPKYAAPSKLYTKMDFSVTVNTYNASDVSVSITTTVTCDIFGELESMLGLGIQTGNNELWSVVSSGGTLKIQARRYGHGIGMSQRGAMYMAQLGFSYDEILGFYYPGCTRVGCIFTHTVLSPSSSETITTSENPAEIETGSTDGSVRGVVTLSTDAKLAVRSSKSDSASVLTVLTNGTPVRVLSNDGAWCLVTFGNITGYVQTGALTLLGTAPESSGTAVSTVAGFAVVTANGYLNLRSTGSFNASILSTAPAGAIVTVLSWDNTWANVQYGMIVGYAASDYLTFSAAYPEGIQNPDLPDTDGSGEPTDGSLTRATVATKTGSLNMRQFPQAGSAILTTIPQGASVTVTSKGVTWSGVQYLGKDGYVMTAFLAFTADTDGGDGDGGQTQILTALVSTQSGSLNLRELPKAGSAIMRTITRMETVQVVTKGSEWSQITYNGVTGYVMTAFLTFIDPADNSTDPEDGETGADPETKTVTAVVNTESGSLNLRAEAVSGSRVLTRIPKGITIEILQTVGDWAYTSYQNYFGYVLSAFLTVNGSTEQTSNPAVLTARVTTSGGSLNLRDQPNGNVLVRIPPNEIVTVSQKGADWCYLRYNNVDGYAMTAYLTFIQSGAQADTGTGTSTAGGTDANAGSSSSAGTATSATVNVSSGTLNLRAAKNETADIITAIPNGTTVTLLVQSTAWCKVQYGAYQGYVQTQYLRLNTAASTPVPSQTGTEGSLNSDDDPITAWVNTTSGALNLRETASPGAAVVLQIPQYAQVTVLTDIQETWCRVQYGTVSGYALSAYLTTTKPSAAGDADTAGDAAAEEDDNSESADQPPMDSTLHSPSHQIIVYIRPPGGAAALGLFDACSEDAELLQNMTENTEVEIIRVGDTWCEIIYQDQSGYCLRDGLSFFAE